MRKARKFFMDHLKGTRSISQVPVQQGCLHGFCRSSRKGHIKILRDGIRLTLKVKCRHLLAIVGRNSGRTALVMLGIALVACGSEDLAAPGNKVSLIFTGKSHSEYLFTLENPTTHAIHFRAFKSLWFAPMPAQFKADAPKYIGDATARGDWRIVYFLS